MVWTDERVELLKKLWVEGHSASQIAARLTSVEKPITRNAVIGKVHRLNLTGRVMEEKAPKEPKALGRPQPSAPPTPTVAADVEKAQFTIAKQPQLPAPQALPLINGGRVTVLHLSDKTCKWPIGDPGTEDFCFCGHTPRGKSPYCDYHARAAYQPMQDRRYRRFA